MWAWPLAAVAAAWPRRPAGRRPHHLYRHSAGRERNAGRRLAQRPRRHAWPPAPAPEPQAPVLSTTQLTRAAFAGSGGGAGVRHESRRHAARTRRFRDDRHRLVRRRRAAGHQSCEFQARSRAWQGPKRRRAADVVRRARGYLARRATARADGRPRKPRLQDVPRQHGRVRRVAAAELARRGEPGRQGSGAGPVRQHLQQSRA